MIEFFLSKFWAMVCAFLLLGVASASINQITIAADETNGMEGFQEFIDDIQTLSELQGPFQLRLDMDRYILDVKDTMTIRNGSAWLEGSGHRYAHLLPVTVLFIDSKGAYLEGNASITLVRGSVLVFQKERGEDNLTAYEEKVATSLRTASMNILQSSSSL